MAPWVSLDNQVARFPTEIAIPAEQRAQHSQKQNQRSQKQNQRRQITNRALRPASHPPNSESD